MRVIVMLTKFLEKRRIKAHCYWPNESGEEERFGDIYVRLIKVQTPASGLVLRKFSMQCSSELRKLYHIHYTEWWVWVVRDMNPFS